jgi:leucyl-tRNA synthetase
MDRVFANNMNRLIAETDDAFGDMRFRDGLKSGWYEFVNARNVYRDWCAVSGVTMNKGLTVRWMKSIVVLMTPITPHWSEHLWSSVLKEEGFVVKAPFPTSLGEDKVLTRQSQCLFSSLKSFRQMVGKAKKKPNKCTVLVVDNYPAWKEEALTWMIANKDKMASKEFMKVRVVGGRAAVVHLFNSFWTPRTSRAGSARCRTRRTPRTSCSSSHSSRRSGRPSATRPWTCPAYVPIHRLPNQHVPIH